MAWPSTKYAVRSVARNVRRTALSIAGIGIGCALALFMESMNRGRDELFARMGAYSGSGHLRVVPSGWPERRDVRLRLADWQRDLTAARELPGAQGVTVRARAQGLLAMGTHVVPLEIVGVDPVNEPSTDVFVRRVRQGRYLEAGEREAIVVGEIVADRLGVEVEDEILASTVGQGGDIENAMFRIVGIVTSGSAEIDANIAQVPLPDLEQLTGLTGAGEVTLVLADWRATDAARGWLAPRVAIGDRVLTWGEISPEFKGHMEQDKATSRFVSAIILLIVLLGVASAQLASVLERRREFAVLSALGMNRWHVVWLVLQESLALGIAGALVGLGLGAPIVWRFARVGLDLRTYLGSSYTFEGVIVEPVIYGDYGTWVVAYVLLIAVGAYAGVCALFYFIRDPRAVALDLDIRKLAPDHALDGKKRVFRIGDCLALSDQPGQPVSGFGDRHHRGRGARPFFIFNNLRLAAFNHGHGRIRRPQINPQYLCHNVFGN